MPCACKVVQNFENHEKCPVCLSKFDGQLLPYGLSSSHNVICRQCLLNLHPDDKNSALLNKGLSFFLGIDVLEGYSDMNRLVVGMQQLHPPTPSCDSDALLCGHHLLEISKLSKAGYLSRPIIKKVVSMLIWYCPEGQEKLISRAKSLANRILLEFLMHNQTSNYRAQQQLWLSIRNKSCQFMGPALQDEALKLVLLALEDGSALSKKVLIMFIVQRLNPEFPQATKTSIGQVLQLLYRSGCFHLVKNEAASENFLTLKEEYRSYDSLREAHDMQIMSIGIEAGIHFNPEQWSHILYGDNQFKSRTMRYLDKLTVPQTFEQLTAQFLISIQRMTDKGIADGLMQIHPYFLKLATCDAGTEPSWENAAAIVEMVFKVFQAFLQCKNLRGPGIRKT